MTQLRAAKDMRPANPAPVIIKRQTCEGCGHLAKDGRPRCLNEDSDYFRSPRETYHDRCPQFSFRGRQVAETADIAAWSGLGRGGR